MHSNTLFSKWQNDNLIFLTLNGYIMTWYKTFDESIKLLVLHTYFVNKFLTSSCSCQAKYFCNVTLCRLLAHLLSSIDHNLSHNETCEYSIFASFFYLKAANCWEVFNDSMAWITDQFGLKRHQKMCYFIGYKYFYILFNLNSSCRK